MLIDTHAHLNFSAFRDDADETVKRALDENIWMINVGSQYSTSERAVFLAEQYREGVYAAIGIHPIHLSEIIFKEKIDEYEEVEFYPSLEKFDEKKYIKLAKNKKVVAIGEIGLDYFHNKENKEKQKEVFSVQIDMAMKFNLPIIIHCREAHNDTIEMLEEKMEKYGKKLRGVVHCFSGRLSQARIYTEKFGFYLGLNGIITFDRSYDKVLQEIDPKYFLVETDCPYLTPVPFRGKRNEPSYVGYVAKRIAEVKNMSVREIEKITTENAKRLFNLGVRR